MAAPFVVLSAMVAARRFLNLSPTFRGLLAMPRTGETRSPDSRPARGAAGRSAGSDAGLWLFSARRQIDSDIVPWRSSSTKARGEKFTIVVSPGAGHGLVDRVGYTNTIRCK